MKKFIRITSVKTIQVTSGLDFIDNTNVDAHVGDRLKVTSAWARTRVLIKEGTFYYPAIIKTWGTVKALVTDKVITLGDETDECDDPNATTIYDRLKREIKFYEDRKQTNKKVATEQKPEAIGATPTNTKRGE